MKRMLAATAAMLCGLSFAPFAQALPQHQHDTATATAAAVPAQRWTPDAPLREGMRRVHVAVDELHHYELGHMSAPMAMDRVTIIEDAVTHMFANCKLAPAPDAALHDILVPLLTAARALKTDPTNLTAVADMRAAIAPYPHYFDDPGWVKVGPATHGMHDEP
jgi:hypothetical protein